MVAILHNIRSLYNVGSIFRTADGAGISMLYLCGFTPTPVDEMGRPRAALAKVSLGAEKTVAWEYAKSTTRLIDKLKEGSDPYTILAIEQSKHAVRYDEFDCRAMHDDRTAIVVGHEVNGLPQSILKRADAILEIPMHAAKESLNVSVAFGIAAYYLIRQCASKESR